MLSAQRIRNSISIAYALLLWLGVAIWNASMYHSPSIPDWVVIYTLAGLLLLGERIPVEIFAGEIDLRFETEYLIGFALVYPLKLVIWAGLLYSVVSSIRYKQHWYTQMVNAVGFVLCTVAAKYALVYVAGTSDVTVSSLPLILIFAVAFMIANAILFEIYMYIRIGSRSWNSLKAIFSFQFVAVYGITMLIGLLLSFVLHAAGLAGAILFSGLTLLIAYSYRDYFKMANHFKQLSVRDELTGLHNHRHIQSLMDGLIADRKSFALLMMDIDHFKRYNEVWGHVKGDDALKEVAGILTKSKLPDEEIARYSGEEFAIVLPDYDLTQAQVKAELLRKAIEDTEFPGADRLPGNKLTVSIGVARYPDMAEDKTELLTMVDDALYKGKFTGRNKVSIYNSVLDEMKEELSLGGDENETVKTIKVFLAILNSKDRYTYAHTERDVLYASALAEKIGLSEEATRYLRFGAFLHDIGKVEIPLEVLTKRGPLTREEWQTMKSHVEIGVNIAKPIPSLGPCLPIIRHHHERFDGTGYPDGLKGHDIPLEARILTIADSFDAMTTSRPYQRKRTMEEAFEELRSCANRQFDPELIEPFIEVVQSIGLLSDADEEVNPA